MEGERYPRTGARRSSLTVLFVVALAAGGERLAPRPEEGRVTTKRYESESSIALTARELSIGGEGHPMDLGDRQQKMGRDLELTIVDEELAVEDGRVTKLRRTYDDITGTKWILQTGGREDVDHELSEGSDLEGLKVVFEWDDEAEDYVAVFDEDSEGDEDLLEDLTAVCELAELLSPDEVEEGDGWELEPELLLDVLRPFGDLSLHAEDASADEEEQQPEPEVDGELSATWESTREEDGARLAVVELEFEVELTEDTTESARRALETRGPPPGMREPEIESATARTTFAGRGTLLWDLDAGRARSVELEIELGVTNEVRSIYGEGSEVEEIARFEGSRSVELRFER